MPKYLIERETPGAGKFSAAELQAILTKPRKVLREFGPEIQWVQSHVTDEKVYGGTIDPTTAEG